MGLRFRKSVTICKGIRLNIGKTGVSVSSGIPGFRKTVHSSGRVTTSVGIPGTGLYYVDTKNPLRKNETKNSGGFLSELFGGNQNRALSVNNTESTNVNTSEVCTATEPTKPVYPVNSDIKVPSTVVSHSKDTIPNNNSKPVESSEVDKKHIVPVLEPVPINNSEEEKKSEGITNDTIKNIFENCDVAIDWVDVISHKIPTSEEVVPETWEYLHKKAVDVFDGDIDTYLEIISTVNPYDDLLDYAEDFEFGTDDASYMEIEFSIIEVNTDSLMKSTFEDLYSAVAIRVARDTFAILPVERVIVHVMYTGKELLNASFERDEIYKLDMVGLDPSDLVKEVAVLL